MNWMTSAKRRAKLKRGAPKPIGNSGGFNKQDRAMVKHHHNSKVFLPSSDSVGRSEAKSKRLRSMNPGAEAGAISRDILFLRKSPPRGNEVSHMGKETTLNKAIVVTPLDLNDAAIDMPHVTENFLLLFNDGHRVDENGTILQRVLSTSTKLHSDHLFNEQTQVPFADDWPQRLFASISTLGSRHQDQLAQENVRWTQDADLKPAEVLPYLYGAMNGGRISETSHKDMSSLLDLIRYVEMVEKNSALPVTVKKQEEITVPTPPGSPTHSSPQKIFQEYMEVRTYNESGCQEKHSMLGAKNASAPDVDSCCSSFAFNSENLLTQKPTKELDNNKNATYRNDYECNLADKSQQQAYQSMEKRKRLIFPPSVMTVIPTSVASNCAYHMNDDFDIVIDGEVPQNVEQNGLCDVNLPTQHTRGDIISAVDVLEGDNHASPLELSGFPADFHGGGERAIGLTMFACSNNSDNVDGSISNNCFDIDQWNLFGD